MIIYVEFNHSFYPLGLHYNWDLLYVKLIDDSLVYNIHITFTYITYFIVINKVSYEEIKMNELAVWSSMFYHLYRPMKNTDNPRNTFQ